MWFLLQGNFENYSLSFLSLVRYRRQISAAASNNNNTNTITKDSYYKNCISHERRVDMCAPILANINSDIIRTRNTKHVRRRDRKRSVLKRIFPILAVRDSFSWQVSQTVTSIGFKHNVPQIPMCYARNHIRHFCDSY